MIIKEDLEAAMKAWNDKHSGEGECEECAQVGLAMYESNMWKDLELQMLLGLIASDTAEEIQQAVRMMIKIGIGLGIQLQLAQQKERIQ